MHQRCKHSYFASGCSDFQSCIIARAPKESHCESCACIFVLVQSPVAFEGEFKVKLLFFFFILVKLRQLKGKCRLYTALRSGSTGQAGRIHMGSTGTLFPLQHIFQGSSNHSFAVL